MDLELLKNGLASLDYSKRKKKWILALGALGFTGYGAYKIYNMPSVVKKRQRFLKLLNALVSFAEMVSDSAEAIGTVTKDFKEFIKSDSNEIPNSLKQISKISRSDEFTESVTRMTRALTVGILRGYQYEAVKNGATLGGESSFSDRVIDRLFSDAGCGFASVVIGSFTRNLVMAFYSEKRGNEKSNPTDGSNADQPSSEPQQSSPRWVEVVCEDKCRELIAECIQVFVSTAVAVYLDRTTSINTYNEMFSGLTNPKHETRVRDMLISVFNAAVETFVRTSHQVSSTNSGADLNPVSPYTRLEFGNSLTRNGKVIIGTKLMSASLPTRKLFDDKRDTGWMRKMSSTLAVPSNRKFVLDMTGKVTFETVRSFLQFILEKLTECLKRSVDIVQHEVVDRGLETIRYVSGKSSAVATVCITLCLHILNSPWILAPY